MGDFSGVWGKFGEAKVLTALFLIAPQVARPAGSMRFAQAGRGER